LLLKDENQEDLAETINKIENDEPTDDPQTDDPLKDDK